VLLAPAPGAAPESSAIGSLLRHALGLTAWKAYFDTRWSLRANPSSGNLHPTEAYVIAGSDLVPIAGVHHYAPDRHALERRCACELPIEPGTALVALTSVHWREAWKYGERAFRYCQHDLGHAIAAIRLAAALAGWTAVILPEWSHREIATLTGIDRDADYIEVEREDAGSLLLVDSRQSRVDRPESRLDGLQSRQSLIEAVRGGVWSGRANLLSTDHVEWTLIDDIAQATVDPGRESPAPRVAAIASSVATAPPYPSSVILKRRSAVAFDPRATLGAERFFAILARLVPDAGAPWDALWWDPRIHLLLFVHRVDDVEPGVFLLLRAAESGARLMAALGREFVVERVRDDLPLVRLARGDGRRMAERVSCDQDIAGDGFFSLGMIAELDRSLHDFGASFYRHLYWEAGVIGQVLYLEAESAGGRGTGIGCFYDDEVHNVLGLTGHAFQSLYHFAVGSPIEDTRLTVEPGYPWG
jgi:SagB-type dehydrogenase family enzyme